MEAVACCVGRLELTDDDLVFDVVVFIMTKCFFSDTVVLDLFVVFFDVDSVDIGEFVRFVIAIVKMVEVVVDVIGDCVLVVVVKVFGVEAEVLVVKDAFRAIVFGVVLLTVVANGVVDDMIEAGVEVESGNRIRLGVALVIGMVVSAVIDDVYIVVIVNVVFDVVDVVRLVVTVVSGMVVSMSGDVVVIFIVDLSVGSVV